jgi:hypothetical protein
LVGNDIDHLEALLHKHAIGDGVLNCDFDLDAAGVRLCPDEVGVDNPNFAQVS